MKIEQGVKGGSGLFLSDWWDTDTSWITPININCRCEPISAGITISFYRPKIEDFEIEVDLLESDKYFIVNEELSDSKIGEVHWLHKDGVLVSRKEVQEKQTTFGLYFKSKKEAEKAIIKHVIEKTGKIENMKKQHLQSGMVVTDRDGEQIIVLDIGGKLKFFDTDGDYDCDLDYYTDDLGCTCGCGGSCGSDIMKVEIIDDEYSFGLSYLDDLVKKTIWTRVEKTEQEIKIEELESTIKQAQQQIQELKNA